MSTKTKSLRAIIVSVIAVAVTVAAAGIARTSPPPSDPGNGDWPMWGGTPDRNMVSNMKGLPTT